MQINSRNIHRTHGAANKRTDSRKLPEGHETGQIAAYFIGLKALLEEETQRRPPLLRRPAYLDEIDELTSRPWSNPSLLLAAVDDHVHLLDHLVSQQ